MSLNQEGMDTLVNVHAQLGHCAFTDPSQPNGLHQVIHAPGGHAADPGCGSVPVREMAQEICTGLMSGVSA